MPTEIVISNVLGLLAVQLPLVVIAGLGLWHAVLNRRQLARVSNWAMWGFSLLIAYSLTSGVRSVLSLLWQIDARTQDPSERAADITRLQLLGVATYLLLIVGVALIARAVFLNRNTREPG